MQCQVRGFSWRRPAGVEARADPGSDSALARGPGLGVGHRPLGLVLPGSPALRSSPPIRSAVTPWIDEQAYWERAFAILGAMWLPQRPFYQDRALSLSAHRPEVAVVGTELATRAASPWRILERWRRPMSWNFGRRGRIGLGTRSRGLSARPVLLALVTALLVFDRRHPREGRDRFATFAAPGHWSDRLVVGASACLARLGCGGGLGSGDAAAGQRFARGPIGGRPGGSSVPGGVLRRGAWLGRPLSWGALPLRSCR